MQLGRHITENAVHCSTADPATSFSVLRNRRQQPLSAATVRSQLQTRKVMSYSRRRGCKTVRHDAACQKPVVGGELKIFPWHKSEGMNRNLAWRVDDGTGSLSDAEPCAYLIRSTRLKKITSAGEPVSNLDGELLTEEGAKVCVGDLERIIPFEQ